MPEIEHWIPPDTTRTLTLHTTPGAFCRMQSPDQRQEDAAEERPDVVADQDGTVRVYVRGKPGFKEQTITLKCSPEDGDDELLQVALHEADETTPAESILPSVGAERELSRDTSIWRARADFDPFTADPGQLEELGYPPRPDRDKRREEFATWSQLVSAAVDRPQRDAPMRTRSFPGSRKLRVTPPAKIAELLDITTSPNWGGVGYTAASGTFTSAVGIWRIPSTDNDQDDDTQISHWVGIDGFNEPDVIQAGFTSTCKGLGGVNGSTVQAWYEWFPDGSVPVDLAAGPGEQVYARVAVTPDGKSADFFLINGRGESKRTTGVARPGSLPAAGNLDQAEWIVERPGWKTKDPNKYLHWPVPIFSPVEFTTTMAVDDANSKTYSNDSPHRRIFLTNLPKTLLLAYASIDSVSSSSVTYNRQGASETF